ncbi:MAG TPA: hypothetical protein PLW37_01995, partial [bacterium]|nr:hypothetical protein [bacterium]
DVPECVDTLTITGMATDGQSMSTSSAPKYNLLARKDEPVIWTVDSEPLKVDYDTYIKGDGEWVAKGLESGKRYYFQFINTGPEGLLYNPKAVGSWSSENECNAEVTDEEVSDNEVNDEEIDDTELPDDQINPEKKDDSGCSLSVI